MDSREIGRLRQKCFSFGKTLMACKHEFGFSLKVGDFEMSLEAGGKSDREARPRCIRKQNPAYFRRQRRRRKAFLEKKGLAGDSLVGRALGIGAETVDENIQDVNIKQEPPRKPLKLAKLCKHFLFPFFSFLIFSK